MMREIEGARGEGKQGKKHPVAKPIRERILAKAMTVHGGIPPNTGLRKLEDLTGVRQGVSCPLSKLESCPYKYSTSGLRWHTSGQRQTI